MKGQNSLERSRQTSMKRQAQRGGGRGERTSGEGARERAAAAAAKQCMAAGLRLVAARRFARRV
eukprot:3393961-Rhodomonas_salina.2